MAATIMALSSLASCTSHATSSFVTFFNLIATRSQQRLSRDSLREMASFAMKSAFVWPPCASSALAPTDGPQGINSDPICRAAGPRSHNIQQGFENCREAIGWDHDIMVHCHREYDLRTSIQIADVIESIKPVWLEDPPPVDYSDSWKRLCESSKVPHVES
jgi:L-alanine-DL-glutamate epimerase-like enolase superfamily enzyme